MADDLPEFPAGAVDYAPPEKLPDFPLGAVDMPPPRLSVDPEERFAGKQQAAREQRDARIASIQSFLGGNYDPAEPFSGGATGYLSQFDIARSPTLADKQRKFRRDFQDGDLIQVPTDRGPVLLARASQDQPYREISDIPRVAGAVVNEPMLGAVPGMFVAGPIGPLAVGAGVFAGAVVKSEIEKARGFPGGQPGIIGSAEEGALATAIDAVGRGAARLFRGASRPQSVKKSLLDGIKASEELGLEPLRVGQVGGPFQRGAFRQVAVTTPRIENVITAQEESLLRVVRESATVPDGMTDDALLSVIRAQQKELGSLIQLPTLARKDAGTALDEGVKTWRKATGTERDRLYAKAMGAADDVVFDLTSVQALAQEIKTGILGKGSSMEGGPVRISQAPPGELANVVDKLLELKTQVSKFSVRAGEWTAWEQIKTLRTRIFDLKFSDDGGVRREATRLYKSMTEVMDNPVSGSPEFTEMYQRASAFNYLREDTLEKAFVAKILRTDTPTQIAAQFFQPAHAPEALATLRDILPAPQWQEFRSAFLADVMNSPTAAQGLGRLERFKSFNQESLGMLASHDEQKMLEAYLRRKVQFEASPAQAMIAKSLTESEKFVSMAREGTIGEVADAVRLGGGIDSAYAVQARAGVYLDILNKASKTTDQGVRVIDADALINAIGSWRKNGKLDALFRPEDWKRLIGIERYAAPVSGTGDIGGGMMAGGLRQKAIQAPGSIIWDGQAAFSVIGRKLFHPIMSMELAAEYMARPAIYEKLASAGEGKRTVANLALGMVLLEREFSDSASGKTK